MSKRNLVLYTFILATPLALIPICSNNDSIENVEPKMQTVEVQEIPPFESTPYSEAYGEKKYPEEEKVLQQPPPPKPEPEPEPEPQPEPVQEEPIGERVVMNVTAYTAGYESTQKKKGEPGYGITASGAYVKQGRTIAAGKQIPFGTKIYIPYFDGKPGFGDGVFTVEDRGGAIGPYNIDVYYDSLEQARQFGRQNLEVFILED